MLITLSVENFLTIDHIELDFESGLTVLTGESGAGKSILMDALMFSLGHKFDGEVVRPGQEMAEVAAGFFVPFDSELYEWLSEQEINCQDNELIIRRTINRSSRTKAFLNGKLCSLQQLKSLGEQLVHIHGQHAHQELLHIHTARSQLDRYAGHFDLIKNVENAFREYQSIVQRYQALDSLESLSERFTLLQSQREELASLALEPNEIESLYQEHKRLHHLKDYVGAGAQLVACLDEEGGVCTQLSKALHMLRSLPEEESILQQIKTMLNDALIQSEEAAIEARSWVESLTEDPERMQHIEDRMSLLHQMSRKYRVEVAALPPLLNKISEDCVELEASLSLAPKIETQLNAAKKIYEEAAKQLRESRLQAATQLSGALSVMMHQLGMAQGEIIIQLQELERAEKHGLDKVEYLVKTNPGMSFQPLAKVLSGGELSRVSLAIELKTGESAAMPTFIFDEVDVGIGGKIAAVVGNLLRQLGERVQVLCVTHQPQVAAFAHYHLGVKKCVENNFSVTRVNTLTLQQRAEELALMLGGIKCSTEAIEHAKSLLEEAQCQ